MASSRLTAYLRAIKTLTNDQYGRIRSVVADAFLQNGDGASEIPAKRTQTMVRLILLSCAVCGIELCYAAETAFVSPIILRLGVPATYATLAWCLSPLLGLILGPLLGSLSDRCPSPLGRRRPFILMLSGGIVVGLLLVPRGASFGVALGDRPPSASCVSSLSGIHDIDGDGLRQTTTMTTVYTKVMNWLEDYAENDQQLSVTSCCEKRGTMVYFIILFYSQFDKKTYYNLNICNIYVKCCKKLTATALLFSLLLLCLIATLITLELA